MTQVIVCKTLGCLNAYYVLVVYSTSIRFSSWTWHMQIIKLLTNASPSVQNRDCPKMDVNVHSSQDNLVLNLQKSVVRECIYMGAVSLLLYTSIIHISTLLSVVLTCVCVLCYCRYCTYYGSTDRSYYEYSIYTTSTQVYHIYYYAYIRNISYVIYNSCDCYDTTYYITTVYQSGYI